MNKIITIENLHKSFKNNEILKGINLEVDKGTVMSVAGKSGSGKTTLLRCINFLEIMDKGSITIDGTTINSDNFSKKYQKNLQANSKKENNPFRAFSYQNETIKLFKSQIYNIRSKVGFLFQDFQLFNHLSVIENVQKPLQIVKKKNLEESLKISEEILLKVDMLNHKSKMPSQLSGGQKQRVAIARALAMSPKIMLYDEPTSALDPELVKEVVDMIKMLQNDGITQIIVTHEMNFLRKISDIVVYLENGEIIEKGNVNEIIDNPSDSRTKKYFEIFRG